MGFFRKLSNKMKGATPLMLGCVCVFFARFVFHLLSGAIFFLQDAVWVSFPAWATSNAFIYSFIYQCVYIPADCLIAALCLYALYKTNVIRTLEKIIKPKD
jgi:thiamine transporter ThiT